MPLDALDSMFFLLIDQIVSIYYGPVLTACQAEMSKLSPGRPSRRQPDRGGASSVGYRQFD
jgi:hypothetical protein